MLDFKNFPFKVVQPNFSMRLQDMGNLDPSKIKHCVWHHVGASKDDDGTAAGTNKYHRDTNGWAGIGYHGQIRWDGTLELGRPLNKSGVHAIGYNHESLGFVFSGNFNIGDINTRRKQFDSGVALGRLISVALPKIIHVGHSQLRPTSCPGTKFPLQEFLTKINAKEQDMFTDLKDAWYPDIIEEAAKLGLIGGYADGTFRPKEPLTREQLVYVLMRYRSLKL